MKIHAGFQSWTLKERTVVTLGNYDGIHLGHRSILKTLVEDARALNAPAVAVTFDPIPKKVLYPDASPPLLQTLEQRLALFESIGMDHALVIAFDHNFAKKMPDEFVREDLVGTLRLKEFVVGENFSFGHQKKGNIELLRRMGETCDFTVKAVADVRRNGIRISSTAIRQMVREGLVDVAAQLLGHPFALIGDVVQGERLGGTLGIPTANLRFENELLPAAGVYVTVSVVQSRRIPSVTNVGVRPTVGGKRLTVEAHLLNFDGDLYGQRMELEFLQKLRDEKRFTGIDELKTAIAADITSARKHFAAG
jgi:riboflavin kinase/FMN adenylyltransferase